MSFDFRLRPKSIEINELKKKLKINATIHSNALDGADLSSGTTTDATVSNITSSVILLSNKVLVCSPIKLYKTLLSSLGRGFSASACNKSIYFSICFDGNIKWSIKNNYDKYISMMFNKHQQNDKGTGNAMGAESIKYIETYSKKKNYNVKTKDSSWDITSLTSEHIKFKKMYLDTIYNGLKHDQNVDKKILKEWHLSRSKTINLKKDRVIVGHKDILVLT